MKQGSIKVEEAIRQAYPEETLEGQAADRPPFRHDSPNTNSKQDFTGSYETAKDGQQVDIESFLRLLFFS